MSGALHYLIIREDIETQTGTADGESLPGQKYEKVATLPLCVDKFKPEIRPANIPQAVSFIESQQHAAKFIPLLSVRRIPNHRFLALFWEAENGKADSFTQGRLPV